MNGTDIPRVSVIVPTYNAAATIREALASVAAQTFTDFEVIVIDDASTDQTPRILEDEFAGRPGVHVLLQARNQGPAAARNAGMAQACGRWVAFLDGDDAWLPDRLAVQIGLAGEHPEVALWCGAVMPLVGGRVPSVADNATTLPMRELPLKEFAFHNAVATSTVLVKREALLAVGGFDPQFRGPEDYDLWMRVASQQRLMRIERPLSRYRLVPGSLSMDDRKFLPQVLRVLDKAFGNGGALAAYAGLHDSAVATQYWNASWMAFNRGARLTALRLLARAYQMDHRSEEGAARAWGRLLLRYIAGDRPLGV